MDISFKVSFGPDVRRFTLTLKDEASLLEQLLSLIGKLFELNQQQIKNLELKYIDNEGDFITIGAPCDLKESLNHMTNNVLKLSAKVSNRQIISLNENYAEIFKRLDSEKISKRETIQEIPSFFNVTPLPSPFADMVFTKPFEFPKYEQPKEVIETTTTEFPKVVQPKEVPIVQKLDLSKLQSTTTTSTSSTVSETKCDTPHSTGNGINSARGSSVTSARGSSFTVTRGGCVSLSQGNSVSTYAGGSVPIVGSHGSAVYTKQGGTVVTTKGSSIIVQKK